ncbi:lanthionine synthetase C family protein [Streptomyces anandii]|uniref:Lanthionine synthetase C family protein n=1 Tax=Streptomyces anandii TaxID=285454 RepID=A0ABW6HH41_9ACTN
MPSRRSAAADLVIETAKKMTSPAALEEIVLSRGGRVPSNDGDSRPMWEPLSLAYGFPGVTLLYAELGHHDPYFRDVAHEYLRAAAPHAIRAPVGGGLYSGLTSFAFSARIAAHRPKDYSVLRARADTRVGNFASQYSSQYKRALADGSQARAFHSFDVINGMSGVGRHLLRSGPEQTSAVKAILEYLIELTVPRSRHDGLLPGWWVDHGMNIGEDIPGGHGNFGLAHGVSGPLGVLSLAWHQGHQSDNARAAIHRMAEWLLQWRQTDSHGVFWPTGITLPQLAGGASVTATRPSWCYGTPGIANALRLAGKALGEDLWVDTAHDAVRAAAARSRATPVLEQPGLCHGLSGLLFGLETFRRERPCALLDEAVESTVREIEGRYNPDTPFGFTVPQEVSGLQLDHVGFLDGVAGMLLALWAYATGEQPRSGWDAALVMS